MRGTGVLPATLFAQLVFLGLVISTAGIVRMVLFGCFWAATIATLFALVSLKRWHESSWVAFGAFSVSLITGVLFSTRALQDPVGVGVSVMGLLFVSAAVVLMPERRALRRPRPRFLPNLIYSVPGSEKYHKKGCRMLTDRDDLEGFISEEDARKAGKSACRLCC